MGSDGGGILAASAAAAAATPAAARMRRLDRLDVVGGVGAARLRREAPCIPAGPETRRAFREAWERGGVMGQREEKASRGAKAS